MALYVIAYILATWLYQFVEISRNFDRHCESTLTMPPHDPVTPEWFLCGAMAGIRVLASPVMIPWSLWERLSGRREGEYENDGYPSPQRARELEEQWKREP